MQRKHFKDESARGENPVNNIGLFELKSGYLLFGQDSFVNLLLNKLPIEHVRASEVLPALSEPL